MNNSRKLFFYGIFAVVAVSATFGTVYASHNSSITNLIGDTGSVGIGTLTPTSHMSGVDSSITNLIGDTGSVGIGTITPTSHSHANTNLISRSGSIGIGTTTPTAELEVVGDIKLSGSLVSDEDICIGNCDSTVVAVSATFGTVDASHNSSITNLVGDTGSVGIGTITPTSHTTTPTTNRISNIGGSIGIGTTTPTAELEVVGDIKLSGSLVSDGDICIGTCDSTVVAVSATFGTVDASHNSSITNLIGDTGSVGIGTITPTSHSHANINLIKSIGSVGIGTTTPTAELEVVGDIKLSGSLVSDENICMGNCDSTPPS